MCVSVALLYAQDQQHPCRQRPLMHHCAKEHGKMGGAICTGTRRVGQGGATLPSHGPRRYRAWSERVSPEVCLCAHDHEQKQSPLKGHSAARRMAPRSCVVRTCGGRGVGGKTPRMASASASGTTLMLPEQSTSQVAVNEWLSPSTQFLQTRLHSSCEP